jgi:hypothetical protein
VDHVDQNVRLVSHPRTICIFLKNSERRARNTSSPCANFFLNRIGPICRQASEMSETSSATPIQPLRPPFSGTVTGDAVHFTVIEAVSRKLIVGSSHLKAVERLKDEIGLIGGSARRGGKNHKQERRHKGRRRSVRFVMNDVRQHVITPLVGS